MEAPLLHPYIVQKGETLFSIGKAYGVSQAEKPENLDIYQGLKSDFQALKIPALIIKEADLKRALPRMRILSTILCERARPSRPLPASTKFRWVFYQKQRCWRMACTSRKLWLFPKGGSGSRCCKDTEASCSTGRYCRCDFGKLYTA